LSNPAYFCGNQLVTALITLYQARTFV